jgi:hypothetical protein
MTHPFGGGPGKPGVLEGQEKARTHTRACPPPPAPGALAAE